MVKRVFVAVNFNGPTLRAIEAYVAGLRELMPTQARFSPRENWHLTVSFLGNQDFRRPDIFEVMAGVGAFPAPRLDFERVVYGPREQEPRMIWLLTSAVASRQLGEIKISLEEKFEARGVIFKRERRPFDGHVTLARFRSDFRLREWPPLSKFRKVSFQPVNLDLMESKLSPSGASYTLLQNFSFARE